MTIKLGLDFLDELKLLTGSAQYIKDFEMKVKNVKNMIAKAKLYREMGDLEKAVFDKQ